MESPPDQLHVPAGTITVLPGAAELMAFCTSVREHDAALIVAALAGCRLIATTTIVASTNIHLTVFNEIKRRCAIFFKVDGLIDVLIVCNSANTSVLSLF